MYTIFKIYRNLAQKGLTSVEYWSFRMNKSNEEGSRNRKNYISNSILTNLEEIFGTKNIFSIFLPSIRQLKCDGINWNEYN